MEFFRKQTLQSLLDEERNSVQLPSRASFAAYQNVYKPEPESQLASTRESSVSVMSIPLCGTSAETSWTLSPMHRSSPCSLLYQCLTSLHRHEGDIFSVAVSGDVIFTGSETCHIHVWEQPYCTKIGHIKANAGEVRAILAYGRVLFTTHGDFKIRVWNVSIREGFQPKKITSLPRRSSFFLFSRKNGHKHKDHITCMAYNHVEKLLYTGSQDRTVKAWKVSENRCVDSFLAHKGHVNAIVINQQDGCVFTCSSDGTVKIWRRVYKESTHMLTTTLTFQPSPVNALALSSSPNTGFLYSGSSDGLINFWEKERMSGRFNNRGFLQGHHFAVLCLVAIGEILLSGSEDTTIRIWRREGESYFHSCLVVIDKHQGPVTCLAAASESENVVMGLLVYSVSLDQTLKVWQVNLPTQKNLQNLEVNNEQLTENIGFEINPILSPSWVEKKLQGNHF